MNDDEFLNDRDCTPTPKGETPRTDANVYDHYEGEFVEADFARELERELISAQIDAGIWKERAEHAEQNCGRAIELALEKTQAELTRALRVVDAARRHAVNGDSGANLFWHVTEWEAGR